MNMTKIEDLYPLSPAQQGMLFHTLVAPESGVYCEQLTFVLQGPLDLSAFHRAWQQALNQFDVLRASFAWEGVREAAHVIHRQVALPVAHLDWSDLTAAEQAGRLEHFLRADRTRGFDLSTPPLMRLTTIQFGADRHQVIWTYHHILLDGWATSLVLQTVVAAYQALVGASRLPAPEGRPFREYILWLRRQRLVDAQRYWREALDGVTAPTPLMIGRAVTGSPDREEEYDQTGRLVPASVTAGLQGLARQHRLTLSTLLHGAWALLLSQYSGGQRDLLFGTAVSGRPASLPGVESMVGLFLNTLPLRVKLDHGEPLLPWLQALQARQLEMRSYEFSPLSQVQQWSQVDRGLPLFETILVFENYPFSVSAESFGHGFTVAEGRSYGWTNYPLTLLILPGHELSLQIKYDRRRFPPALIDRILAQLDGLLAAMAANPARSLDALLESAPRLLPDGPPADRPQPAADYTAWEPNEVNQSIPARFQQQALRYPQRLAVKTERHALTYAELDAASNRLAHHLLQKLGSQTSRVCLLLEHDAPMLVAILGVLKAGKTYVPLDPAHPLERLKYIFQDAAAETVVTNSANESLARGIGGDGGLLIDLEALEPDLPTEAPPLAISPDALAYILYTSGSTGQPKGVMQSHRNVLHHIGTYTQALRIGAADRLSLLASYTFDAALMDIFGALLNGAALFPTPLREAGLTGLPAWIRENGITIYHSTPTVYRYLLEGAAGESFPAVRLVVLGGEPVSRRECDLFRAHFPPGALLVNGLGPTESTLALQHFLTHDTVPEGSNVAVGYPVAETEVWLLDEQGRRTELFGEIAIRSRYVALGYWNKPELTAAAFLPDPEGGDRRIYRTGDLGRLLPDGSLEFMGRRDFQVKIRGHRIELGEIEQRLLAHPGVREALVAGVADGRGEMRLAAYLVPAADATMPDVDGLRAWLREALPEYMFPAAFVTLDTLPMTPTGKVDRRALPRPESVAASTEPFVTPRNQMERTIADVWAGVLGRPQVGARDNFFDLGGHSLLLMQVHNRLGEALKRELRLVDLFQHPTVEALARHLAGEAGRTDTLEQVADRGRMRREALQRLRGSRQQTGD